MKEYQKQRYIILAPIASFKFYCLDRFLKNILSFYPKPKEMVFCAEPQAVSEVSKWKGRFKKRGMKLVILPLDPAVAAEFPGRNTKKLVHSRERLRHYFTDSKFDWALWLDSDIIPEPNVAGALLKVAYARKCLVVASEYEARDRKGLTLGATGCLLTHKSACIFAKFLITPVVWQGREIGCLADDFWFYSLVGGGDYYFRQATGWRSQRLVGRFVSIRHVHEDGEVRFLKKDPKFEPQWR